ncbi:ATP-binding cassette domain-containing protein [Pseudocitrobacter cyperus]|uniref:ATP-binding cassette domain-containing protein n=1 Tax=Pseudocitrobacter cyperus TaxID=3112843 RepID=A0ABV0HP25_9ENTR
MSKLVLEQVTKTFGKFYAAREISFCAKEGECVTLPGPSGYGNTTLLKMIGGFHQPNPRHIQSGDKAVSALLPGNELSDMTELQTFAGQTLFAIAQSHQGAAS